jgi:hypothetical protein
MAAALPNCTVLELTFCDVKALKRLKFVGEYYSKSVNIP